ncbi:MAG: pilus assembly protein PilC [Candidatus Marinimicrobia bacterium]|nr:pilus assembly protein PilC [Candidatus Neomarinimicrobiota bacterium]|tara:strand:- start:260 stop:1507 length:1248 start_codon:yes stop_codon:yes gene_type:complete
MSQFTFIARTQDGKRKEGSIEAANINKASEKLTSQDLIVVKLTERDSSFDFMGPFLDRLSLKLEKLKTRLPLKTLVFFTRQLSTMFAAGLTIEKSLFFLAEEEKNKKFKKILHDIELNIKRGLQLSDSLEKHPGVFNNLYISLVRAGEVSGKLAETLEELALYLESVEETQRKVKSAMYYPIFIIGFLIVMLLVTFTFIIPEFESVYRQMGQEELPFYTEVMLWIADAMQKNFMLILLSISFMTLFFWSISLTDKGSLLKDKFLLKVPIFGKIIEQGALSKFNKTFGILIGAGVSVLDSMSLISRVVDNRVFEIAVIKASKQIENGITISQALKNTDQFPPIMIQLLKTGEETGEIDNLALRASEFYTKQVNAIVDRLTSLIEPLLIVLVGGVIGVIVVVTYLPIFNIGQTFINK